MSPPISYGFVDSSSILTKYALGGRTMRESKFRKSQVQTLKQAGVERPR